MAHTPLFARIRTLAAMGRFAQLNGLCPNDAAFSNAWAHHVIARRTLAKAVVGLSFPTIAACKPKNPDPSAMKSIAVVGGGMAGLHCAWRLKESGVLAVVYEASDRLGGRVWSARDLMPDDQVIELGGELIDTNHLTLWMLADELGLTLDDRQTNTKAGADQGTWWFANNSVDDDTLIAQFADIAPAIGVMVESAEATDGDYDALNHQTLADWLSDYVPPAAYPELHAVLTAAYRGEFGLEPEEQSALNLLYIIGWEDPDPFSVFGDSDERYHTHGGNDLFISGLADRLDPSQLQLGHALVAAADGADGGFLLSFRLADGSITEVEVGHVVFALPFSVLRDVDLDGLSLSDEKRQIIDDSGYGTNSKVMAAFTARVWNDNAQDGAVTTDLPFQQTWDTSIGQEGATGILTNYLGGLQGVASGTGTPDAWIQSILADLDTVLPGTAASYVAGSAQRMHWPSYPWAKGSYACYRPGQWDFWGLEGMREGNLHFCGEQCSLDFQGWMEGAAETGALVAAEVLDDLDVRLTERHSAWLLQKLQLPQACYHGDLQRRPRWSRHRHSR